MRSFLKTLVFTSLQVPLIAFLAIDWGRIKERPFYAVLVVLGYELFALGISFGKKVWDELERDAVGVAANWIRGKLFTFTSGFSRRYRRHILHRHGIFNVRGLGMINTYTLPLDQVFVNLGIDSGNPQKFNRDLLRSNRTASNHELWHFLRLKGDDADTAAFAVIGPPGCGKTTLLQHVAITFAQNRQSRYRLRRYLPILLFLRDHVTAITESKAPLAKLVEDYLNESSRFPALRPQRDWFKRRLLKGRCVILLDGLDEVGDLTHRETVARWIDDQIKGYSGCIFIVTSRPQGYRDTPLEAAHVLEVQPFNFGQVQQFIKNWYLANEVISSGNRLDNNIRERAGREAADLLMRLQYNPTLKALTANPLLLTMIAMVHCYHGALPGTRIELFAEICEVLLGRWRQGKGISEKLKTSQKLVVLRPLAAQMMNRRLRDITLDEVLEITAAPLKRIGIKSDEAPTFLRNLQEDSGLVVEREHGRWSFAHLTLQEYLTSTYWLDHQPPVDWSNYINDSWWHETLRLYAAQTDASELIQQCLSMNSLEALILARDFLEEARELDPQSRSLAEDRLIAAIESPNRERRALASEVLLSRRLRSLKRIDDFREIDLEFVTAAEYQLFLNDLAAIGKNYQPDHWPTPHFPKGSGLAPVSGVRPEDAVAFCEWLTQRRGDNSQYRVPRADEAEEHPSRNRELSTWCRTGDNFRLVGLDSKAEQAIIERLKADFKLPFEKLNHALFEGTRAREYHLALALADALNLARSRDMISAISSDHSTSNEELSIALELADDLATYIEEDLDRNLAHKVRPPRDNLNDLALARRIALDIDLSRNLFSYFFDNSREFASLSILLDRRNFVEAKDLLKTLQENSDPSIIRRATLTIDLLAISEADSESQARELRKTYAERLLEYAQEGRFLLSIDDVTFLRSESDSFGTYLSGIQWWRQLAAARKQSSLHAWECIRIVRELPNV